MAFRLVLVLVLAVLGVVFLVPSIASADSLLLVERADGPTVRALVQEGVVVARMLEGALAGRDAGPGDVRALVYGGAALAERLAERGIPARVLETDARSRDHYIVFGRDAAAFASIDPRAARLYEDDRIAVVSVPEGMTDRVAGSACDVERVFRRPIRTDAPRARGVAEAAASKMAAFDAQIADIVASVRSDSIDSVVLRLQNYGTRQADRPKADSAAAWIRARMISYGITDAVFDDWSPTYAPNVVGTKLGSANPGRIVLVGAHFDSYTGTPTNAPGADDNASGTAAVLECARVLAGTEFSNTIRFVAFSAEEFGLFGSEAYATAAAARGDTIIAMLNLDMIGYRAPGDLADLDIISNGASEWIRDAAGLAAQTYVPNLPTADGYLTGGTSDHQSFWGAGYDAIFFFEDSGQYSPYIHTTSDVVGTSYNDPALALSIVQTAAALLATLADPFDVSIAHTPLGNTEETTNPYVVTATITSRLPLDPDSLRVVWRTTGDWFDAPLLPDGGPGIYSAEIPAQPGGIWVEYYLVAADTAGRRVTHPDGAPAFLHRFFVGTITPVWADDFETNRGWVIGAPGDNATTGIWERGDPQQTYSSGVVQPEDDHTPAPGVNCLVTGRLAGTSAGQYDVDNGTTTVTSPLIDLTGLSSASLSYWRWYTNDLGGAPGLDPWRVQVSSDGATWFDIENTTGGATRWVYIEQPLEGLITLNGSVRVRFIAADIGSGSLVEALVDDVAFLVYQDAPTGIDVSDAGRRIPQLGWSRPNPARSGTVIPFALPQAGRARLAIYDASGRLVRALVDEVLPAGRHAIPWDGRNGSGEAVASGHYLYRLDAGDRSEARQMILLR